MEASHSLRRALALVVVATACWPLAAQRKTAPSSPTPVLLPEYRGTVNSRARDVNDNKVIVGTMWDSKDNSTTVAWIPSGSSWTIEVIAYGPPRSGPFATAINNLGEILLNREDGGLTRASVRTLRGDEVALPIPAFTPGANGTYATSIDDNGVILGLSVTTDLLTGTSRSQTVLWVRDGTQWKAVALDRFCNKADRELVCDYKCLSKTGGWIAGEIGRVTANGLWGWAARAWIDSSGGVGDFLPLDSGPTILSKPPVEPLSGAMAVNGYGQSSGYVWPCLPVGNGCTSRAAFWDVSSNAILLPTYEASTFQSKSIANGINDHGEVVGIAVFLKGGTQARTAAWWKYQAPTPIRLGTPTGYSTAEANAINNTGLAVGTAQGSRPRAIAWKLN